MFRLLYLFLFLVIMAFAPGIRADSGLYISEIMADNDGSLLDRYGDESDWIELYNASSNSIDLAGWYLTDNPTNLTQWAFPSTNLPSRSFLVVFASDRNETVAGEELHTNFKLSASGEYIALVQPDGTTIENAFPFPEQLEDVSWGYAFSGGGSTTTAVLVDSGAACSAYVPTTSTDAAGWKDAAFDDSSWPAGRTGVGYERSSGYDSLIGLDIESSAYGRNASVYIRVPFTYSGDPVTTMRLHMKYDDGFVAYLNGTLLTQANAPSSLAWNSNATSSHSDSDAVVFQTFDVSDAAGALRDGANVLAIQGMNVSTTSSDMLCAPLLDSTTVSFGSSAILPEGTGMLAAPTPGAPNKAITYIGYCETPQIGTEHGFFNAPFQVSITNITDGAVVRYTTDGSTPTESNSTLYTGPITISGTTLLRASAFKSGHQPSTPVTRTYLFVNDVLKQDGSGLQSYGYWGHAGPDWAVNPGLTNSVITDSSGETFMLADALLDLPTVSLVTDWDNWWSDDDGPILPDGVTPWQGIYADPIGENGVRRPVSMEFFTADGSESFTENGQVSVVGGGIGGTSADRWKTDKLSMRVAFTDKLNYPVYGEDAAQKYNGLVLDAHLGFSWAHSQSSGQRAHPKYLTDAIASDMQNRMSGKGAPHGRFVHLYLNGLYWGLYDMHERPDEHFAAEYFGGQNEDYDSIKHWPDDTDSADSDHDGDPYNDNITNGDDADLQSLLALSRSGLSSLSSYQAMDSRLDIDGLIDYLLVNFFYGNNDWAHKNWYTTHNAVEPDGLWRYHCWDVEHIIEVSMSSFDVASSITCDVTGKDNSGGPTEIHQDLTANAEYRLRFADHVHNHFFNGGTMTVDTATALFWSRVQEMEMGMLGEAARWADNTPGEGHGWDEWFDQMTQIRDLYLPYRSAIVLSQLQSRGLYPSTAAPEFEVNGSRQHGGLIDASNPVTIDSEYTVYYTTDGSDPRAVGGAVAGSQYTGPLFFSQPTRLKARAYNGGQWSALCDAEFLTAEVPLAITELMYHAPSNQLDFIEIRNISQESVELHGYKIDSAAEFKLPDASLAPGQFLVVIKDIDAFSAAYDTNGMFIAGEYKNDFDNSGEKVELEFWNHDLISFRYSDARNWPQAADGAGHSLVPLDSAIDDEADGSLNYGGNWRASTYIGGSPGWVDPLPPATVLLNEITAHTDTGEDPPFESNDQIELYNPTGSDVTLNGWYLSDDRSELHKWAIPAGTVVPAHGFVLFDEDDFHPDRVAGFGLDKAGEEVVLSAPDRIVDVIRFKGQLNGASLGRYPDGAADWLMTLPTPEAANQPIPESVWISALMYNPPAPAGYENGNVLEYIQLENRASGSVFFKTSAGAWRIDGGVSYTFPDGFKLTAGEKAWLVSFDPTDSALLDLFCSTYGLDAEEETVLGPYSGQLSNEGERVALELPQDSDDPLYPEDISWVVVDELFYFDRSPWPTEADGSGAPLIRTGRTGWGVTTEADQDADQLDDAWENAFFGSLSQTGSDDFDHDGFSNLQESICGTDPTDNASFFRIERIEVPEIEWTAVTGRTYSVYWTDDLQQPFVQIATVITCGSFSEGQNTTTGTGYYFIAVEHE
ncbi:MAG: lamin tail domain-containing protein [Pontiellaceae bacterium]|nr:lamin tail domain-containing protein [Pontiellaceae bacterium]MBN2786115.1 lamin tail domain-containing protein [Pontiellaceae bacterium]